jgi:hypothetical protein
MPASLLGSPEELLCSTSLLLWPSTQNRSFADHGEKDDAPVPKATF